MLFLSFNLIRFLFGFDFEYTSSTKRMIITLLGSVTFQSVVREGKKMFGLESVLGPLSVTFLLGIVSIILLYWYTTKNHDYWRKRGVPYIKPLPLFGNILDLFRIPTHELDLRRFKEYGTVYGTFEGNNPILSVSDPKLIRDVFVKDFSAFPSRRQLITGEKIFDSMLSVVKGDDWKRIRTIVTPTFTTGKIKRLLGIFKDCAGTLMQNFQTASKEKKQVNIKRFYGAFTMDVIASSAFSTKLDSHNDPDNVFVKKASAAFTQNGWGFVLFFLAPRLLKLLPIKNLFGEFIEFFKGVTYQIIEERKRTGQVRNDFLQLLLDTVKEEKEDQKESNSNKENEGDIASNYEGEEVGQQIYKNVTAKDLSKDELVAQCIIFFLAGSETTAATLAFSTYLLAINPDVRDKLRAEVDQSIGDANGELTYEAIQSMKYLDNVISETLRMYPPALRLERRAETDYKLADTGITIQKGVMVVVPTFALHRDPISFPDPEKFDPDRFTHEQRAKRDPYAYAPFGAGPRNCVAMRFALMEIKICLAHLIAHFEIERGPETKVPLEFRLTQGFLMPKEIIVDLQLRNDSPLKI